MDPIYDAKTLADVGVPDCSPNVRKVRDGRTLRFLAISAVKENEELCISYGHIEGMDWSTRQKRLLEGWYFSCRCSRCRFEEPGEQS